MKRLEWYPFLFALHPIVYTYAQLDKTFSISSVLIVTIVILTLTLLLHVVLGRFYDGDASDITISVFWVWLFSYSSFRILVQTALAQVADKILIPVWVLILVVACTFILRKQNIRRNTIQFFTVLGILMVLIGLWPRAKDARTEFKASAVISAGSMSPTSSGATDSMPNIYYLLLDSYPSPKVLNQVAGIADSELVNFLLAKGFQIPDNSYCNYPYTLPSLSSTLNMQYLPMVSRGGNKWDIDCNPNSLETAIRENLVLRFLKSRGYKFVDLSIWNFGSESDYTYEHNYYVDRFVMELLHRTAIAKPIIENIIVGFEERKDDKLKLEALAEVRKLKGPIFAYVHLYSTHEPYVLDERGDKVPLLTRILEAASDRVLFEKQMRFVNTQAHMAIEELLRDSGRPPVIIVQGDHGPQIAGESKKLRMGMFSAFYLPGPKRVQLPSTLSPVNNFRIILDNYFDTQLELLPNKNYYPLLSGGFIEASDSLTNK
jgi:hypothetical protein